jgi:hypothetical protein
LKFFFELKTKEKISLNVDSIIWYNSSLKIEGKTLFFTKMNYPTAFWSTEILQICCKYIYRWCLNLLDLPFAELLPSLFFAVYYPTENWMEIYTHNFSPGMKITVDKMKILGITIPTNGKYENLIKLNL